MAEGRERAAWRRTAELLCLTANCHRDVFKPRDREQWIWQDFFPYADDQQQQPQRSAPEDMRRAILGW